MRWHLLHGTISEANLGSHCCVTSGWHSIAVWFAQIFRFRFSLVIVFVLVRSASCDCYSYIVFVSQIVIVLVFVLTERSSTIIVSVFVFVTKKLWLHLSYLGERPQWGETEYKKWHMCLKCRPCARTHAFSRRLHWVSLIAEFTGVAVGQKGQMPPQISGKYFFSGRYHVKFGHS